MPTGPAAGAPARAPLALGIDAVLVGPIRRALRAS